MKEEFEKLAAQNKINAKHIDLLVNLTNNRYCHHRSWGFGKITTVDTVMGRFVIDFEKKPGHYMALSFAAESLKTIPKDHILARKVENIEQLRQMAALHHLDLIKLILQSNDGKATVEQIQGYLIPDIIKDDWRKWWEAARSEMKKDGHFILPVKKSDPIIYQTKEVSMQDRLMGEFRAAKGLKARQTVAHEILKSINDLTDKTIAVTEVINSLNQEILSHQRTQPSVALEAIFVRDELRAAAGLPAGADTELTTGKIWAQETKLAEILDQMPAAKHRKMLQSFKDSTPVWIDPTLRHLNKVSAKLAGEFAHLLMQEHRLIDLKEMLARLISQHQASTELLLWLAKERSDTFADILGPEVFRAMLTAMERDQFNEKKSNRLRDFILDDQNLLVELIGSADIDVIKDLTRALQLSPCFDDMDKRSLLARIVKSYPAIQTLITGDTTKQDSAIIVSWPSLERRKDEYQELVQKKIPANSKEIAIARSYGDLRENHEYKAAKEMQKILMRRKSELEQQLVRARGSDFSTARLDLVSLGTIVNVTDLNAQHAEVYTILGAWDSDPEKGVVSYLSPLAKALIGKKIGEEIEFDMDGVMKKYRVDAIALAKPVTAPVVAPIPSAEAQPPAAN